MTLVHSLVRASVALALAAVSLTAFAQAGAGQPPGPQRPNAVPVGDATRNLLAIQRSGTQAGPLQPLTGEQAALSYARYMQSFQYPLPEFYTSQATGSPLRGGGGGAQSLNGR
ncbi:DUF3613 domain-containing protein [Cupriavidus agavae]|uniref:Uncharacterized protein DUF3613 n=1 Tax=Cupriavidus agavae TaxID=1001822 RepID=A0A4Q7R931_9BURK|nr:DUF3613 domain-containing protein [Cupriavidus agavae]RZT29346.1 uncharacterized protein DUF3613 [Cupriavidus agavae]